MEDVMKTYNITVTDTATYTIRTNSLESAIEAACEYFSDREPEVVVTLTDEEPECTIWS